MEETMQFLNREFESVKKSLTATHHEVLKSFHKFLSRNEVVMKERDFMIKRWKAAEMLYSMRNPVLET